MNKKLKLFVLLLIVCTLNISAGTTGKIYGKISNIETGAPVPAVSVILKGTKIGAASNYEGDYFIINVPPGVYTLESSGVGYQMTKIEGVKVAADKSTLIDIKLKYSDKYELVEKMEQFYLQKFSEEQRQELLKLKGKDKLKYQRKLLEMYFKPPVDSEDESAAIYENILQLTKQIEVLGKEYKLQDSEQAKKKIQQDTITKLEERFTLQEKKMQLEIKKLSEGIANLQRELQKFKTDKEIIIQKQFEMFVD